MERIVSRKGTAVNFGLMESTFTGNGMFQIILHVRGAKGSGAARKKDDD